MKKNIGVCLLLLIITSLISTIFCFADSSHISAPHFADRLSEIGMFNGTGNGFELDRAPTRLEGLIMLIRLLGKSSEVDKQSWPDSGFNDVPEWAKNTVNYAKVSGLTNGIGSNKFGSNMTLSTRDYATLLLRALQLDDQSSWQTAEQDIVKLTKIKQSDLPNSTTFLRSDVAKLSYITLLSNTQSGERLLNKLVNENAIDKRATKIIIDLEALNHYAITTDNKSTYHETVNTYYTATNYGLANNCITADDHNTFKQELFTLVNAERRKHGLTDLKIADAEIEAYAQMRTDEIAEKFGHVRPNGDSSLLVLKEMITSGENIASGQLTPEEVLTDWLNSPVHRVNILSPNFEYLAIGFKPYNWVQIFYTPPK